MDPTDQKYPPKRKRGRPRKEEQKKRVNAAKPTRGKDKKPRQRRKTTLPKKKASYGDHPDGFRDPKGKWLPGRSANPGGFSKNRQDFEQLIKDIAADKSNDPSIQNILIERAFDFVSDPKDKKTALRAIEYLTNQGWGRAHQRIEQKGTLDGLAELAAAEKQIAGSIGRLATLAEKAAVDPETKRVGEETSALPMGLLGETRSEDPEG